jgi:hypothetical protein
MSDLVHTLILCGLLSGTQPLTLMGLLIVLGGATPRANGLAFVFGAFLIQTSIVVVVSAVFGGTVPPTSGAGRSFIALRIVVGLALLVFGFLLRRPTGKPIPEIPHALERLRGMGPRQSFVAGIIVADYQGPALASLALTSSSLSFAGRLAGLGFYTLFASGIPLALMLVTTRSERARDRITRATNWVMGHRRVLASWFSIVGGLLLVADGVVSWITT